MVTPAVGAVVLVRFPFSDLSQTRLRPAIVLADAGRADWVKTQAGVTSDSGPPAIPIRAGNRSSNKEGDSVLTPSKTNGNIDVSVRPMQESDLRAASRLCRVAFGTFFGVPDPESFWVDREYASTRFRADPGAALVAEVNGKVVGSNIATNWGSFGFFGPLTVDPEMWGQRIAQRLLAPTMDLFAEWGVREAGLRRESRDTERTEIQKRGHRGKDGWERVIRQRSVFVDGRDSPASPESVTPRSTADRNSLPT